MSQIITTTYPSSAGLYAASYACSLAGDVHCAVHLIHAYTVPVTFGETPLPMIPVDDILEMTTARVNTAITDLRTQHSGVELSSEVAYGDFGDLLEEAVPGKDIMLAVIGNDEEDGSDVWIGSDASSLLREAPLPILAVPQAAVYSRPAHICLACDSNSINEGHPIDILIRLQATCGTRVTILHLLSADEIPVNFEESNLGQQLSSLDTTYVEMSSSGEVDRVITDYAVMHGVDWLALIPHQYGFWEGLFHKSHTERMLHLAHIPVLALH